MLTKQNSSPTWHSKVGFILATASAAVGLGNIQRFPYVVAQNGGGAFLLLYLFCVILVGLPLVLIEFAIGRSAQKNPVSAMIELGGSKWWGIIGALGALTAFSILTYYVVAAGWTLGYAAASFCGQQLTLAEFSATPHRVILCTLLIQIGATLIVSRGINAGVEKFSKLAMPVLVVLLTILVVYSCQLSGSSVGLRYYLLPDFSRLTVESLVAALSQAFFSLCVGEAVLMTYGSYARKSENLVQSALFIALFDTTIAIMAGLVVFPALFVFGEEPAQGVALLYDVMPKIFDRMGGGSWLGGIFFSMLTFAGLTTCVALLEIPAQCLHQYFGWSKKRVIWVLSLLSFCASIPAALSQGASTWLSELQIGSFSPRGYYEIMDYLWGGLAMVLTGFATVIFCGWVWSPQKVLEELEHGSSRIKRIAPFWNLHIRWILPILLMAILLSLFIG